MIRKLKTRSSVRVASLAAFASVIILAQATFLPAVYGQNKSFGKAKPTLLGASNYPIASVSAESRSEILKKLPYQSLSVQNQAYVKAILSNVSMYRRLPVQVVNCEPEMFEFASCHPDVIVNIWELMGISQMSLRELGPEKFYMEDKAGTRCIIEVMYRTEHLMVLHAYGTYEGAPFPNPVKGRGLVLLQHAPVLDEAGNQLLAIRLDAFMQIDNDGVEALMKTFQPLVGKVADYNLNQVAGFMSELSKTACSNGIGVANMARRLNNVRPEVQEEFADVALRLSQRSDAQIFGPMPLPMTTAQTTLDVQYP